MQTKISIITPSYNQGKFIEETIQSVLNQDYPHLEHIICDGASTDNTMDIIRKYEDTYPMQWISEPDRGQVDAILKGFSHAQGEVLAWLNSDDVYLAPNVLSRMVSLFHIYPQVDIVSGAGVIMDENGKWIRQTEVEPARTHYHNLRYRPMLLQPATFFKRKVLETVTLDINLHYTFDWDFWIRLSREYNLLVVNELWAGYRWWGQNKTASGVSARTKEQAEVTRRYLGKLSWQYWMLSIFYYLYRGAESLPGGWQPKVKTTLRKLSTIIHKASSRRIAIA